MTGLLKQLLSICQSDWREIQIALPLQGRIQKWGFFQTLVQKDRWTFLWQITSHRDGHVFLNLWTPVAVGAGNTALRAEANISVEGNQKQSHFLLSLEFSLVAKKKITQLESDIRSCQRKNFSLKQASGLSRKGGGGVRTPRTLPLDPPLRWGLGQGSRRFFADVTNWC